jgi:Multicopper oxidase
MMNVCPAVPHGSAFIGRSVFRQYPWPPRFPHCRYSLQTLSAYLSKLSRSVHQINDKLYRDQVVDQTMFLDTVEAWKISNKTDNIAHPFHIHINPFQIVELFQPNSKEATDPNNPCYADPARPETWRACRPLPQPWVWWDTFSIPTARQEVLPCKKVEEREPAAIRPHVTCMKFPVPRKEPPPGVDMVFQCRVTIPGSSSSGVASWTSPASTSSTATSWPTRTGG